MLPFPIQVTNELPYEELATVRKDLKRKQVPHGIARIRAEDSEANADRADADGYLYAVVRAVLPRDRENRDFMESVLRRITRVPKDVIEEYHPAETAVAN